MSLNAGLWRQESGHGMELVTCRKLWQILSIGHLHIEGQFNDLEVDPGSFQQLTEPVLTPSIRWFQWTPQVTGVSS